MTFTLCIWLPIPPRRGWEWSNARRTISSRRTRSSSHREERRSPTSGSQCYFCHRARARSPASSSTQPRSAPTSPWTPRPRCVERSAALSGIRDVQCGFCAVRIVCHAVPSIAQQWPQKEAYPFVSIGDVGGQVRCDVRAHGLLRVLLCFAQDHRLGWLMQVSCCRIRSRVLRKTR